MRRQIPIGLLAIALLLTGLFALVRKAYEPSAPREVEAPLQLNDPWLAKYTPPRGYVAYRAVGPIQIDGKLDDPAWQAAPWSEDFVDIEGDRRPKPRYRTRVKMLWDEKNLYLAAELEEPHVWATLTQHDSYIFHDDNDFEVFLNPTGDSHLYAELEMNALNTTWDLLLTKPYKDGGKALDAWEIAGLRTAVHVDGTLNNPSDQDRGWTLEVAWPWQGLKELGAAAPPKDGDQWRINFSRVEWEHEIHDGKYRQVKDKPEQNWVWSPQGIVNMHCPERWGCVQFSTAAPGTATFAPDPTGPARHLLHRVYYAQRDYRKQHGSWAKSLEELGLAGLTPTDIVGTPRLETTSDFYQASVTTRQGKRINIGHDGRVWAD
jgi:Carbohydrate family 9 binding domain-like